jgi:hypothetical protein
MANSEMFDGFVSSGGLVLSAAPSGSTILTLDAVKLFRLVLDPFFSMPGQIRVRVLSMKRKNFREKIKVKIRI